MGIFDDLIPQDTATKPKGMFDDLIPAAPKVKTSKEFPWSADNPPPANRRQNFNNTKTPLRVIEGIGSDMRDPKRKAELDAMFGTIEERRAKKPKGMFDDLIPAKPAEADMGTLSGDLEASWYQLRQAMAGIELMNSQRAIDTADDQNYAPKAKFLLGGTDKVKAKARLTQDKAVQDIGTMSGKIKAIPESPAATKFNKSKTFTEGWNNFWADPLTVTRSTTARSAAISLPSVVGGIVGSVVGPAGAAAGAGAGSYTAELGSAIAEGLATHGADLSNPESIKKVWAIHKDAITKTAHERALIVGGADAITGGVSSKVAALPGIGIIKKELLGTATEMAGGGIGEAAAQYNEDGTVRPGAILGEIVGEGGAGAVQQAGQIAVEGVKKATGARDDRAPPEEKSPITPPDRVEPRIVPPAGQSGLPPVNLPPKPPGYTGPTEAATPTQGQAPAAPPVGRAPMAPKEIKRPVASPKGQETAPLTFDDLIPAKPEGETVDVFGVKVPKKVYEQAGRERNQPAAPPAPVEAAPEAPAAELQKTDLPAGQENEVGTRQAPVKAETAEPSKPLPAETLGSEYREFAPSELKVDAKRFQFKEGANDAGVTDRLKGVKEWDQTKAGITLVWQNKQGENFVADGHQRHALASRLESEGQKPRMLSVTLREADGITPEKARAIAAAKNIAEGTGTTIDAAKILRDTPNVALSLPPNSSLVRDAKGLAKLSPDGFGMVVNKKVQPAHAAIVGQLAPDPKTHADLLGLLAKNEPDNVTEAESMVRDALEAPSVQSTMEDMFGSAETTQILFKERAQILSASATAIRKDRAAFTTLVKEEGRIAKAGNKLVTDKNAERATQDAELLATLQATARRKGPIADALATAAKQLHEGQPAKTVIGNFLDVLRSGNQDTGEGGRGAGGTGRQDEAAGEPRVADAGKSAAPPAPREEAADSKEPAPKGDKGILANIGRDVTGSPAFKAWFGNSKVVDESGKPMVVYHGTAKAGFDEFDTYGSNYGLMGQGAYFTENPAVASEYTDKGIVGMQRKGDGVSQAVIPAYLSIKNPIDMNTAPDTAAWAKAFGDYIDESDIADLKTNEEAYRFAEDAVIDEGYPKWEGAEIMQDGLRSMGFDGITHIGGGRVDKNGVRHRVWVAFDPEQIKSATGNKGTFDPGNKSILANMPREKPFYSALVRAVEGMKQPRAQASQWLGQIRNSPGVKPEEISWIGLEDWLSQQTGSITKDALLAFLAANQVEVKEVVKGEPTDMANTKAMELYGQPFDSLRTFEQNLVMEDIGGATKFQSYQLPGGENYRELLLTLPEKDSFNESDYAAEEIEKDYWQVTKDGRFVGNPVSAVGKSAAIKRAISIQTKEKPTGFRSSHFDEPNVLAHIRFNERVDADGRRTLFLEEIQSDFGQATRKSKLQIVRAVKEDFDIIVEQMKIDGVLEVDCD